MMDKHCILLVDDNPNNLQLLFNVLDAAGFELFIAQSGEDALLRAEMVIPSLILLDVMMPDISGFETCRRLKANPITQDIPVIFMTALNRAEEKVQGFELGAVDYITKPIDTKEVLARIHTHLHIQDLQHALQTHVTELAASLEREQALNQLKSRFLSIASHEFRTPLTNILLSSSMLQRYSERMAEPQKQKEFEAIAHAVQMMQSLLDDVLIISKGEAGKIEFRPETTDVEVLCRRLAERFNALGADRHEVRFSAIGEHWHVCVDARLLEHLLSNLLTNAIKYSPQGGIVTFDLLREDAALVFRIADQGIGISKADQQHLFESFYRAGNVGSIKGTGLGLSIVKQFVEMHQGTIRIESELNHGSTFIINLPIIA